MKTRLITSIFIIACLCFTSFPLTATGAVSVLNNGIKFPDSTVQTTAAVLPGCHNGGVLVYFNNGWYCGNILPVTNGASTCIGDVCNISACMPGFANCNGDPTTGCTTRIDTVQNCGVCGNVCTGPQICSAGTCTDPTVTGSISGTVAAGSPILGTVTVKDSSIQSQTKTVTISATGSYTVDVTGMAAPLMLKVDGYVSGNSYQLYSAATSTDVGGIVNITPFTDLIVANVAGVIAKTYYDNGNFSGLTTVQLNAKAAELKTAILPVLTAATASNTDLLRTSFSADHTGYDAVLDILKVDVTAGVATITNIITNQQITKNIASGAYSGTLTNVTNVAAGIADIQAISARFAVFSNLFATSVPSATDPALLGLYDNATFLTGGQNLASFLADITGSSSMIGLKFTNMSVQAIDPAGGTAKVSFFASVNGNIFNDGPKPWSMIKKSGTWYSQGDQRIASVSVTSRAAIYTGAGTGLINNEIRTGIDSNIKDKGNVGIASAIVTGKGLPAQGVTLVSAPNFDGLLIQGIPYGNRTLYKMDDSAISQIADNGEIYTVKLYNGAATPQLLATYTEKLIKKPYLNASLSPASFPAITSPSVPQLSSFNGGDITVNWTLPSGLINDWLTVRLENPGNTQSEVAESPLASADRSKIVNVVVPSFPVNSRWIWVSSWDSNGNGRSLETAKATWP